VSTNCVTAPLRRTAISRIVSVKWCLPSSSIESHPLIAPKIPYSDPPHRDAACCTGPQNTRRFEGRSDSELLLMAPREPQIRNRQNPGEIGVSDAREESFPGRQWRRLPRTRSLGGLVLRC
jgi:hypothetical protein